VLYSRYGILGRYERLVIALGVCVATELALSRLLEVSRTAES